MKNWNRSSTLTNTSRNDRDMTIKIAHLFRSALEALKMLHNEDWTHQNLKNDNIKVKKLLNCCVLFDFDQCVYFSRKNFARLISSLVRTFLYLTSKIEFMKYERLMNIWSMKVIFYWLTHNRYSWIHIVNSWCHICFFDFIKTEHLKQKRNVWKELWNCVVEKIKWNVARMRKDFSKDYVHCTIFSHACFICDDLWLIERFSERFLCEHDEVWCSAID